MKLFLILILTSSAALAQEGLASKYGNENHQWRTASGEVYRPWAESTCAHKTARLGSHARVTDLRSGRSIVCRVNDRGPFIRGRIIDLSFLAAKKLGMGGTARVRVDFIK